jgi:hypothetical protein
MIKRVVTERALASLPNQYFIFVEQAELACVHPSAAGRLKVGTAPSGEL